MDKFENIRAHRNDLIEALKFATKKLEETWAEAENREKARHNLKAQIDEYDRALEILDRNQND